MHRVVTRVCMCRRAVVMFGVLVFGVVVNVRARQSRRDHGGRQEDEGTRDLSTPPSLRAEVRTVNDDRLIRCGALAEAVTSRDRLVV